MTEHKPSDEAKRTQNFASRLIALLSPRTYFTHAISALIGMAILYVLVWWLFITTKMKDSVVALDKCMQLDIEYTFAKISAEHIDEALQTKMDECEQVYPDQAWGSINRACDEIKVIKANREEMQSLLDRKEVKIYDFCLSEGLIQ